MQLRSPDDGSFVLAKFKWSAGRLDLQLLGKLTIFGGLLEEDPRQLTRDPDYAIRWQSRQAARQAMKRLQYRLILDKGWKVLNLKSVGSR